MLRSKPSGSSIKGQNNVETMIINHVYSNKNLDDPQLKSQGLLRSAYVITFIIKSRNYQVTIVLMLLRCVAQNFQISHIIFMIFLFWVASGFGQYQDTPLANPRLQCGDWG